MFKYILLFIILTSLITTVTNCQSNNKNLEKHYSIDPGLTDSIERKVKTEDKTIHGTIYIKMFSKDSTFLDTYDFGTGLDGTFPTFSNIKGDTITITGFFGTIYYIAKITKNSSELSCIVSTDEKLFRLKKEDALSIGITLPCHDYTLTLVNAPAFKKGEIIEGMIDFTTGEFYEKIKNNDEKLQVHMTGYFKSLLEEAEMPSSVK